jgi:hypothetical protein
MNSKELLKANPKLIRSFPSDPTLEAALKEAASTSGQSISSIIREALRRLFNLQTPR